MFFKISPVLGKLTILTWSSGVSVCAQITHHTWPQLCNPKNHEKLKLIKLYSEQLVSNLFPPSVFIKYENVSTQLENNVCCFSFLFDSFWKYICYIYSPYYRYQENILAIKMNHKFLMEGPNNCHSPTSSQNEVGVTT